MVVHPDEKSQALQEVKVLGLRSERQDRVFIGELLRVKDGISLKSVQGVTTEVARVQELRCAGGSSMHVPRP